MPVLICYDITSNTLRLKIAKKIQEYGLDRVNRSVFLGAPKDRDLRQLEAQLQEYLRDRRATPDDSLIVLPVHAHQIYDMRVYGRQDWEPEELAGDVHTLIL